jgi:parallel beta-helix repeat protein
MFLFRKTTGGGGVSGSGTAGRLAKWVDSSTLGDFPIGSANQILGVNSDANALEYKTIQGTANQIIVTHGTVSITLSTPQDIHTGASPTFVGLTLSGLTQGSILFAGSGGLISQDNTNLFWDNVNKCLGVGTATPAYRLDIVGALRLQPSSAPTLANGVIYYDSTANKFKFGEDNSWKELGGASGKRTATIIVAANDSLDKTRADYVCDGIADQEEINNAINALPTSGGRVLLLEGTYNISAPITILKNNVILEGQGVGTKLFLVNGANCHVIQVGNETTALEGIRIASLSIDGNRANQTVYDTYGIYFYGGSGYLITKSRVEDCKIENCNGSGIYLSYSDYNTITGNQANSNSTYGICLSSSSNNTITGNQANSNNEYGICLSSSSNNTIIGNQVKSNQRHGIYLYLANNNTILGNQVNRSSAFDGIYLSSSNNNTIIGNQVKSNQRHGIYLYLANNNTILGNQVNQSSAVDGIYLSSSNNNTIVGNICQGNARYGINISDAASENNLVVKNYLTGNITGSLNDVGTGTIKGAFVDNDNVPGQREHLQINTQTTNYTLVLSDDGKLINMNASSAVTLTVPANSSVPFPIGTRIYVRKEGIGDVTISGETGVTINAPFGNTITTQYQTVALMKVGTDTWDLIT